MKKLATMVLKQPPAKTSASGTVPWTLAEMKQLGRTPDSVLARRSGRTIHEVVAMRESRGLGLVTGPRPWAAREIKLLGTMPAKFSLLTLIRLRPPRIARRIIHSPHQTRPCPRRRNLETGAHAQRPRQPSLRPDLGGD
jgi:hypothetical protein